MMLYAWQVDGIVLVPFQLTTAAITEALAADIPIVSTHLLINHPCVDVVWSDDTQGARDATSYIIAHGHRRIGMIAGANRPGGQRQTPGRLSRSPGTGWYPF